MEQINKLLIDYLPKTGRIVLDRKHKKYYRITDSGILQICEFVKKMGRYEIWYEIVPMCAGTRRRYEAYKGKLCQIGFNGFEHSVDAVKEYFSRYNSWDIGAYFKFFFIPAKNPTSEDISKIENILTMIHDEFCQCEDFQSLYSYSKEYDNHFRQRPDFAISHNDGFNTDTLFYTHIGGQAGTACVLSYFGKYKEALEWLDASRALYILHNTNHETGKISPPIHDIWPELEEWENVLRSDDVELNLKKLYQKNYAINREYANMVGFSLPETWEELIGAEPDDAQN